MTSDLKNVTSELEKVSADAKTVFGSLSGEQINWRASAESWSIGQCFEHLIKTNELFYGDLDKIARSERRNTFWENYSPFTSLVGSLFIKSLKKDDRKFKAPSRKIVPPSEVDARIIERFAGHQAEVIEKIKQTGKADWQRVIITSPFLKLLTYKLADGFRAVVEHEKRHFRQAERVLQAEGFPK